MNRLFLNSLTVVSLFAGSVSQAATLEDIKTQLQSTPYQLEIPEDNQEIFSQYCIGNYRSAQIPQPNYNNAEVVSAAKKITETKDLANAQLNQMANEQFLQNLKYVKENLQTILSTSSDSSMVAAANILLEEVSKPNITSISEKASNAYKDMSQMTLTELKKHVALVAPQLAGELQGIDPVALRKIAVELSAQLKNEIKPVDMKVFAKTAKLVQTAIKSNTKPLDVKILSETAEQLLKFETETPSTYLQYVKEEATNLLQNIEGNSISEDGVYAISNLQYYVKYIVDQEKVGGLMPLILEVMNTESAKTSMINLSSSADNLVALIDQQTQDKEQITYTAQNLTYYLSELEGNASVSLSVEDKKAIADFLKLTKLFGSDQILKNSAAVVTYLTLGTTQGNSNAYNTAESLLYSLEDLGLSQATQQVVMAMKMEVAKMKTESIILTAEKAEKELANATVFNSELYYEINDLTYYLQNVVLPVSPATQDKVVQLVQAFKAASSVADLSGYMSSSVEGKEADHYYFYSGVRRLYKLSATVTEEATLAGANKEAHWFLTQLCGEFRDRATMIAAKVKWVNNMNILPKSDVTVIDPDTLATAPNAWMRITAKAYYPYIQVAGDLWQARRSSQERYIQVGNINDVDNPVPGMTVCETKYLLAKYVANGKSFDNVEAFDAGYEQYKNDCPAEDLTDYYDFRGDSNFKHYSPESNAMIWQATSLARGCTSSTKANKGIYTDADCEDYFKRPFFYRYNAARAGLAAWLFRDDKHSNVFSSQGQMVAIYPHREPHSAPYAFGFDQNTTDGALFDYNPEWLGVPFAWNTSDIGFNGFTGLGSATPDYEKAYVLLRDAVDRHTDWYSSGYNDGNGTSRDQAYSPFVASSYVMQSSDGFTSCGTTVPCPPDGLKRWMFVFRIKAKNWYTPARIVNNEPVDFDTMWFDETSFGVSGLADGEHAWDRLGTAMEEELDSILYLIYVNDNQWSGEGEFDEGEFDGEVD
jgi:hypothetical protein